jgi:hypothetical protein
MQGKARQGKAMLGMLCYAMTIGGDGFCTDKEKRVERSVMSVKGDAHNSGPKPLDLSNPRSSQVASKQREEAVVWRIKPNWEKGA